MLLRMNTFAIIWASLPITFYNITEILYENAWSNFLIKYVNLKIWPLQGIINTQPHTGTTRCLASNCLLLGLEAASGHESSMGAIQQKTKRRRETYSRMSCTTTSFQDSLKSYACIVKFILTCILGFMCKVRVP